MSFIVRKIYKKFIFSFIRKTFCFWFWALLSIKNYGIKWMLWIWSRNPKYKVTLSNVCYFCQSFKQSRSLHLRNRFLALPIIISMFCVFGYIQLSSCGISSRKHKKIFSEPTIKTPALENKGRILRKYHWFFLIICQ